MRRAATVLLMCLAFPCPAAQPPDLLKLPLPVPDLVRALVEALKDTDPEARIGAGNALAALGAPAVDALTAALAEPNHDGRAAAAYALGVMGADAIPAIPALVKGAQGRRGGRAPAGGAGTKPDLDIAASHDLGSAGRAAAPAAARFSVGVCRDALVRSHRRSLGRVEHADGPRRPAPRRLARLARAHRVGRRHRSRPTLRRQGPATQIARRSLGLLKLANRDGSFDFNQIREILENNPQLRDQRCCS